MLQLMAFNVKKVRHSKFLFFLHAIATRKQLDLIWRKNACHGVQKAVCLHTSFGACSAITGRISTLSDANTSGGNLSSTF